MPGVVSILYSATMQQPLQFEEIKERYKHYYQEAAASGRQALPYYEIQLWDQVLSKTELCIFEDIRELGIQLYPMFPISETQYFHFANPFHKIGIEIINKKSTDTLVSRKVQMYKAAGWKVYTITERDTYLPVAEFFRLKRMHEKWEFDVLPDALKFQFVKKYYKDNAACLLHYVRYIHFEQVTQEV
jgi:hypothetical protein